MCCIILSLRMLRLFSRLSAITVESAMSLVLDEYLIVLLVMR